MTTNTPAGTIVETQHGGIENRGTITAETHPLAEWVWVEWDHIGRCDENVGDLTVIAR